MDSADIQKLVWLAAGFLGVLVAAGLVWWAIKAAFANGGSSMFGGRDRRRLGLVEWTSIGGGRQLLLVRRDDVEHLILTGGPIDVIVESGIGKEDLAFQQVVQSVPFQESFPHSEPAQASGFEPARETFQPARETHEPVRETFQPARETHEPVRETSARRKADEDAGAENGHLHGAEATPAAKRDTTPLILSVEHAE